MRRKQTQINSDNAALGRCHELITGVLKRYKGNRDATSIVQFVQRSPKMTDQVEADKPMLRLLWREGMKPQIRLALREWGVGSGDEGDPPQLELFPEAERALVKKIGRARIWLPSQQEHVPFHDLDAAAIEQSAEYYDRHGRGEVLLAQRLRDLAAMRRPPEQQAA